MPIAAPINSRISPERQIREVRRQQQQQSEPDRGQHHSRGGERARAEAIRQVARRRSGAQHPDRQRQHVDAGVQRGLGEAVAVLGQPDALQPDDQDEHQAAACDRRQEGGQRSERERPDAEQRQTEHRIPRTLLDDHEGDQRHESGAEQGEHPGAAPADGVSVGRTDAVGDRDHDQDQPEREGHVPPPVDRRRPWRAELTQTGIGPDRSEDPDGHRDQEHQAAS